MKMFSNNINNTTTNVSTVLTNNLNDFENDLIVHKSPLCGNSSNSILASATTSISTHSRPHRSSPSAVNQHRISIQVKVEESSASSGEDNSNGTVVNNSNHIGQQVSIGNQWPNSCIYTCNFAADPRRYIQSEDKCVEPEIETKIQENESNNLMAQRERLFCFGSAFTTNTQQNNSQQYSFADNQKQNILRDDGLNTNSIRLNSLQESVINNTNTDEKNINLSIISELDPIYWEWEHVRHWLELLIKENQLQDIDINRFNHFSGRELCAMTREDFRKLTDSFNGEQVFKRLQLLRQSVAFKDKQNQSIGSLTPLNTSYTDRYYTQNISQNTRNSVTNSRHFRNSETTYNKWGTHSPSPSQGYHHNSISGMTKPSALETHHSHLRNMQDPYQIFGQTSSRLASQGSGQIQLWQFLLELLSDPANSNCITWEGTNGEFKLSDPDEVARRWGERKSKPNMNYDKLSRALRYYYDKNIMTKVHGKRYAYKFDFQGLAQATQPAAADPSAYKAAYQSADLFMHPPHGYHHTTSAAKHLNFAAAVHSAGISSSTSGGIFPPTSPYWTSTGAAANLYSNIAAASATHHASMPHHHHPSHVTSHIGSYYA